MGPSNITPALLMSVSKRPSSRTVCATASVACASSVTSHSNTRAVPPAARTVAATSSSRSFRRAASATAAPCAASASAVAAPIPLDAPVTNATVPANSCRAAEVGLVISYLLSTGSVGSVEIRSEREVEPVGFVNRGSVFARGELSARLRSGETRAPPDSGQS